MLGARYAPCMRRDRELFDLIEEDRIAESQSGCCIRNDGSGCIQVNTQLECNVSLIPHYIIVMMINTP